MGIAGRNERAARLLVATAVWAALGLLLDAACGDARDPEPHLASAGAVADHDAAMSGQSTAPPSAAGTSDRTDARQAAGGAGAQASSAACTGTACAGHDSSAANAGTPATADCTQAGGSGGCASSGRGSAAVGGAGGTAAVPSGGAGAPAEPASCKPAAGSGMVPVVYVIGDSTASVHGADLYPRMGWAQPLQDYFPAGCARVEDKALSGRSSKSFLDEGAWAPIKSALQRGDFVLIQFGHNDEKREDSARYTEPFGSYQRYLGGYVDDALAAGATPILLTPIERNSWSGGKLSSTHGDYPEAVRQLAQMRQLTLVDMTQLTHAYLERLGQESASKLFLNLAAGESPNYPNGNTDNTHLQERGAHKLAELALAELARQRAPLASLLERVPSPP